MDMNTPPQAEGVPAADLDRTESTAVRIDRMDCPTEEALIRKRLAGLANLVALDLREPHDDRAITNAGLKELSGLKRLARLNLSSAHITDAGLKHLTALDNLTTLDISWTHLKGPAFKHLAGLKRLTTLNLTFARLSNASMKDLAALTGLTNLNLQDNAITDLGVKDLAPLTNLTTLNLQGTKVTDAGLRDIARFENLTALELFFTPITDRGLDHIARLKKLRRLGIGHTKITDTSIVALAPLKELHSLGLSGDQVTDLSLRTLHALGLVHTLSGYAAAKDHADPVSAEDVVAVRLHGTKATDGGLKELAPLVNLETLDLSGTGMTGAGLKDLGRLKKLHTVRLELSDAALRDLGALGLIHLLDSAHGKDGGRPRSDEDVETLDLAGVNAHYFERLKVGLPGEPPRRGNESDLVAELALTAYQDWNIDFGLQWNPQDSLRERQQVRIQYRPDDSRVVNLGYRLQRGRLEQADLSGAWPVARHWNLFARWTYDLQENASLERFAGLEYKACCWRLRAVARRFVSSRSGERDTAFYLQLELNGLASVGSSADAFLEDAIRGYSFSAVNR